MGSDTGVWSHPVVPEFATGVRKHPVVEEPPESGVLVWVVPDPEHRHGAQPQGALRLRVVPETPVVLGVAERVG